MNRLPSPNGDNGRERNGQFSKGNPGGPGNPQARRVAQLRKAMLDAVTPEDFATIVANLVKLAKAGDLAAVKELFNRTLGTAVPADVLVRIEELENALIEKVKP